MKHLKLQPSDDTGDALDITDHLRDGILSGLFAPNSPLRIDALATQFNVSHMPIREALRRLESEGLLDTIPNRGARVVEVTPDFVADIFDLRTLIESFMTRRAAERITPAQLADLQAIQTRYEAAALGEDVPGALAANRAFHAAINQIAGNRDGRLILDRHWRLISTLWRVYGYQSERFEGVINDHRQLLQALTERDGEGAAALSAAHSIRAKQTLLKRMRDKLSADEQAQKASA